MKKSFFLLAMLMTFMSANAQVQAGKVYRILNQKSGLVMGVNGSAATGSPIVQQKTSKDETAWIFIAQPDGYFQIRNKFSGKYIANMGSKVEGAVLKQTNAPGEGALWKLVPEGPEHFRFKNKLSNMFIAISGNTAEFSQLSQKTTVGGIGGNWKLIPVDDNQAPPVSGGNSEPKQGENGSAPAPPLEPAPGGAPGGSGGTPPPSGEGGSPSPTEEGSGGGQP